MATSGTPTNNNQVIVSAVLVGLQILNGGAALGDVIGPTVFGLFALLVAAVQGGWSFYLSNATTPNSNVVAMELPSGNVVAGPASSEPTGVAVTVDSSIVEKHFPRSPE